MTKSNYLLVVVLVLFVSTNLFSQDALKRGSYSLSGSITFSNSTSESIHDETDQISFAMKPGFTYFFVDNISAGLSVSFGYYESSWKYNGHEIIFISRPISIGPVIRYYFSTPKFIPFLELSYKYSNSLTGNEDMNSYSFAGGINYFLTKSVALEPYIEYMKRNYLVADQKYSDFSVGLRINYFIIE